MHIVLSALLFILALPPASIPLTGCFFLLPVLIHHVRNSHHNSWISGLLLGFTISAYAFFGAWSYSIKLYLLIIFLTTIAFTLLVVSIVFLFRVNKLLALAIAPVVWLGSILVLHALQAPVGLGLLLTPTPELLLPAAFGGQYLLEYLIIVFQILLLTTYTGSSKPVMRLAFPVIFVTILTLAHNIPIASPLESADKLSVKIVQSNIHPLTTLNMPSDGQIESLQNSRLRILQHMARKKEFPELLIWPEVNFSKYEFRNRDNISHFARQYGLNMLVASPDKSPAGDSYSAIFSISSSGKILDRRSKQLLVPFIETEVPAHNQWLPHFQLPGKPGSLICFESAFSGPSASLAEAGAGLIVIATNDAYAGPSFIPLLHFELSRIRAIETGRTIVRAANGGPSGIINRNGKVRKQLPVFTEDTISDNINIFYDKTFFVEHYKKIMILYLTVSVLGFLSLILLFLKHGNQKQHQHVMYGKIAYSSIFLSLILLVQHRLIYTTYQDATNKSASSNFLHFQDAQFNEKRKYDSLKARSASESLLSATTFLLRDYGNNTKLNELTSYLSGPVEPFQLIKSIAQAHDYSIKDLNYTPVQNTSITTPCLALLVSGETVVIREYNTTRTTIFSPYNGMEHALKTNSFNKKWTGQTIIFNTTIKHWD